MFGALTVALTAVLMATFVDRRSFSDYGFRFQLRWWRDFGFGSPLGIGLMTLISLVELALGWVQIAGLLVVNEGFEPGTLVVSYALTFAAVSLSEELLVRGILLANLAEKLGGVGPISDRAGTVAAVTLTSLLFGALHLEDPNATLISTANIALAGVFLALGYVLTGELAIPLGLHLTWNYVQGVVYGFPVSGIRVGVALIETDVAGPPILTGGDFGPEAGLVGVCMIFLGMGTIAWWGNSREGTLGFHESVWTPDLRWR